MKVVQVCVCAGDEHRALSSLGLALELSRLGGWEMTKVEATTSGVASQRLSLSTVAVACGSSEHYSTSPLSYSGEAKLTVRTVGGTTGTNPDESGQWAHGTAHEVLQLSCHLDVGVLRTGSGHRYRDLHLAMAVFGA